MLGSHGVTAGDTATAATELTLVRHGQTEWHAENRYAGSTDISLDEVGRAQAEALAAWVRQHPQAAVACSPLRRARDTAAAAAEALGVAPEICPPLREMDFGRGEGRTLAELRRDDPKMVADFMADPVHHPFPGAESPGAVARRVRDALLALAERHRGRSVLVVGHNTALRLALCDWLGIPLARYRDVLPRLDNAAITRLRVPPEPARPPALLCLNVIPHAGLIASASRGTGADASRGAGRDAHAGHSVSVSAGCPAVPTAVSHPSHTRRPQ